MKTVVNKQESRGKVEDVWDQGLPLSAVLWWFAVVMGVLPGLLALVGLAFYATGRPLLGTLIGAGMVGVLALAAILGRLYLSAYPGITFSVVLGAIVGLLCIESADCASCCGWRKPRERPGLSRPSEPPGQAQRLTPKTLAPHWEPIHGHRHSLEAARTLAERMSASPSAGAASAAPSAPTSASKAWPCC